MILFTYILIVFNKTFYLLNIDLKLLITKNYKLNIFFTIEIVLTFIILQYLLLKYVLKFKFEIPYSCLSAYFLLFVFTMLLKKYVNDINFTSKLCLYAISLFSTIFFNLSIKNA